MGIPDYNMGQVELMEAKAETELGRADAPLTPYGVELMEAKAQAELGRADEPLTAIMDWSGATYRWPDLQIHQAYITPEESGDVQIVLTPWVEKGPDYLAITRDVVGG